MRAYTPIPRPACAESQYLIMTFDTHPTSGTSVRSSPWKPTAAKSFHAAPAVTSRTDVGMARWPARWRLARRPAAGDSGASPISCNRCIAVVGAIAGLLMLAWGLAAQAGPNLQSFPQVLSPALPYDVNAVAVEQQMRQVHPRNGGEYSAADADLVISAQRQFDILAWQAFLALNWPQKAWNEPAVNLNERDGSPLWSYWVPIEKIFDPSGAPPEFPWNPEKGHQEMVSKGVAASMPPKAAWRQSASANDNFQAFSGPLVDQNGKWVRYEALVNPEEFEYIFKNTLYSLDGQIAFSQRDVEHNEVDFPVNQKSRHGAIEIKLAWKELGADDDRSRFYTTTVRVRALRAPGHVARVAADHRRTGWHAYRHAHAIIAPMDLEHVRADRQRAAQSAATRRHEPRQLHESRLAVCTGQCAAIEEWGLQGRYELRELVREPDHDASPGSADHRSNPARTQ